MRDPSAETEIAALLMDAYSRYPKIPSHVARVATKLCSIGRSYSALQVKLTGGEDVWGPHPQAQLDIDKARARCEKLLEQASDEITNWEGARIQVHDLHFSCETRPNLLTNNYLYEIACE